MIDLLPFTGMRLYYVTNTNPKNDVLFNSRCHLSSLHPVSLRLYSPPVDKREREKKGQRLYSVQFVEHVHQLTSSKRLLEARIHPGLEGHLHLRPRRMTGQCDDRDMNVVELLLLPDHPSCFISIHHRHLPMRLIKLPISLVRL